MAYLRAVTGDVSGDTVRVDSAAISSIDVATCMRVTVATMWSQIVVRGKL